jgi:hypothetical protein
MITNISLFADDYCKPLVSLPNCVLLHFEWLTTFNAASHTHLIWFYALRKMDRRKHKKPMTIRHWLCDAGRSFGFRLLKMLEGKNACVSQSISAFGETGQLLHASGDNTCAYARIAWIFFERLKRSNLKSLAFKYRIIITILYDLTKLIKSFFNFSRNFSYIKFLVLCDIA